MIIFLLLFGLFMVDCIGEVSYVETSLHLWNEAHLILVDDFFDVLLDYICEYFIEKFFIDAYGGKLSIILFFVESFCGLGTRVTVAS